MTRVSYVTCTRNRRDELTRTILALDVLHADAPHDAEFVIADNASDTPISEWLPATRIPVRVVRLHENKAAAARNFAADAAEYDWLVMLDDDSAPLDLGHLRAIEQAHARTAAIMADITLLDGSRERGGLPEVLVGCGAAIRRSAYLDVGGYDPSFHFAAEEPDLCAKLISAGWSIDFDPQFRVLHHKTSTNRDLNRMLRLLTRNQGGIIERTTPDADRRFLRNDHIRRCHWIASKEHALGGFAQGLAEFRTIRSSIDRRPMTQGHFDRFVGLHHAREAVRIAMEARPFETVCLSHEGKHAWAVRRAIEESGATIIESPLHADRLVIATLSPGPMLDALAELHGVGMGERTIAPWTRAARILGLEPGAASLTPGASAAQDAMPAPVQIRA